MRRTVNGRYRAEKLVGRGVETVATGKGGDVG